jgi:hypothetical protein
VEDERRFLCLLLKNLDQPISLLENGANTTTSLIDPELITAIQNLLSNEDRWIIPELKAVCQLAWAVILRARFHTLPDGYHQNSFIQRSFPSLF